MKPFFEVGVESREKSTNQICSRTEDESFCSLGISLISMPTAPKWPHNFPRGNFQPKPVVTNYLQNAKGSFQIVAYIKRYLQVTNNAKRCQESRGIVANAKWMLSGSGQCQVMPREVFRKGPIYAKGCHELPPHGDLTKDMPRDASRCYLMPKKGQERPLHSAYYTMPRDSKRCHHRVATPQMPK